MSKLFTRKYRRKMDQHHTCTFLILCIFILEFCDAEKDYNVTCIDETAYRIYRNDAGIFTLSDEKFNSSEQCQIKVKLVDAFNYFKARHEKTELKVSIIPDGICFYSIDIYIGNPAKNKKITTLDCKNHRAWTGQWPSMEVVMDYHILSGHSNVSDVVTAVRFSKCRNCYNIINNPYQRKKEIRLYNSKTMSFDACRYYELSGFSYCRTPVTLSVKDDIPVCFELSSSYSFRLKNKECFTTISIDNEPALVITYNNWKPWCIPWNLKGKTVSFRSEQRSGFCYCTLMIRTNNSQAQPFKCEPRPQTTTKDWSSNNNNEKTSWDSDTDDSDDDDNVEIIATFTAFGIVGLFTCVCCCAAGKNRDDDDNRQVAAGSNQPHDVYQMKTFDTGDNRSQTAPSASNYLLLPSQQQQRPFAWSNPNQPNSCNSEAARFNEDISNDSLGRREYTHSHEDGRYQRPESNISSNYNARASSNISDFGLHRPYVDRTEHEDEHTYDLSPPPSYEEACKSEL